MARIALLIALLASMSLSVSAQQTATDTFVVSITVENSCTVQVDDLNFGVVSDLTPTTSGLTNAIVDCTGIGPFTVSFDIGTGGGTLTTRQMAGPGGATIGYNIYRNAAHTEILGDGTSAGTFTISGTSTGNADTFPVYGLTAANQNPKPIGDYTSTITATVTF